MARTVVSAVAEEEDRTNCGERRRRMGCKETDKRRRKQRRSKAGGK